MLEEWDIQQVMILFRSFYPEFIYQHIAVGISNRWASTLNLAASFWNYHKTKSQTETSFQFELRNLHPH